MLAMPTFASFLLTFARYETLISDYPEGKVEVQVMKDSGNR